MKFRILIASVLSASLFSGASLAQEAAGGSYAIFSESNSDSTQAIDYQPVDQLLGAFVRKERGRNKIYFSAMSGAGVDFVDTYVQGIQQIDPRRLNRNEQLAYWLNLRNLLILQEFAGDNPRSITKQRGTVAEPGALWAEKSVTVAGVSLSIHDIETNVIAANWDNADILYGFYQGAQGGPGMALKAFRGATVNATLAALGKEYVNARRVIRVKSGTVTAPQFYEWYKPLFFNNDDKALLTHIAAHSEKDSADISAAETLKYNKFNYRSDAAEVRQQTTSPGTLGGGGGGGS